MDINGFNKKLQKISVLTESNDNGLLSDLERDLLLSYIRELYDIALDGKPIPARKIAEPVSVANVQIPEPVIAPIVEIKKEERNAEATIEKVEYKPEVKVSEPSVIIEEKVPVAVALTKSKNTEAVSVVDQLVKKTNGSSATNKNIIEELFAEDKIEDLSGKLSLSPVKDLTKSMGINERIFTQQELFGNNAQAFNEILQKLNGFTSFDETKAYLIADVIPVFGWTAEDKVKKAATFIKLVKRKFI
ncbi:MAG: hypothetical protein J5I52_09315 [Saprospiraceae bacterium]|nr:MAG: hypothetical protein UZ09_BCD002000033 [Bacteroidetes bacterium OLB9]MCO6464335.1 hypothetical protein [Saprospiraceae bacterium]MCZ2338314.1 hypothetical protein [Chitinophagales bacterium]